MRSTALRNLITGLVALVIIDLLEIADIMKDQGKVGKLSL